MANYRLQAYKDDEIVIDKEFGDHWDLACNEFAGLMCGFAYDAIMVRDLDQGHRMVVAFYHPSLPSLTKQ